MLRPLPEEQQGLPDHNFQFITEEAQRTETRLRRKMIINPKRHAAPPAIIERRTQLSTAARLSSPMNLVFAVLSSATFGWAVHNWHGR